MERAVILSESDTFVVDESWLSLERAYAALAGVSLQPRRPALAESHGRIAGPAGAAAKLGIPRQPPESKIKRLGIDRYGQKRSTSQ